MSDWTGQTVAILASGPSMSADVVATVRAERLLAIVINDTWKLMPDAACLLAADRKWWVSRGPQPEQFNGERLTCMRNRRIQGVEFAPPYPLLRGDGGNSALHAAYLAGLRGAATVLLFGVDLRDDQLTHWHGRGMDVPTAARFGRARKAWARFAAESDRAEVINCNPDSGLHCFPKLGLGALRKAA